MIHKITIGPLNTNCYIVYDENTLQGMIVDPACEDTKITDYIEQNNIKIEMISHAIFTLTEDLNAAFPAKFARLNLGWTDVPMMCFNEINVPNSLAKCLRIMVVINCEETFSPKFVYLDGAEGLRK